MKYPHVNEIDDIGIELIPGDIDGLLLVMTAHGQRTLVRLTEPLIEKLAGQFEEIMSELVAANMATLKAMRGEDL